MELSNSTGEDTKYKVTSGGAGAAPQKHPLNNEGWRDLPAGALVHHSLPPPGPWHISFLVNGRRVIGEAGSNACQVKLVQKGGTYRVEVF
jgi:hypothetical protein